MRDIKDVSGSVIPGLKRSTTGGLVVDSIDSYQKHVREQSLVMDIQQLKKDVHELKAIIRSLQETISNDKTSN